VQMKERGREQLASLRTEAAMSGKWAAILSASGWGSKVNIILLRFLYNIEDFLGFSDG